MSEGTDEPVVSRRAVWITSLLIVALVFGRFIPGSAQDTTDQRIEHLETRVAVLENAVGINATPIAAASPGASPVAMTTGANAMWKGSYLDRLPTCAEGALCLVTFNQRELADEYYYGVIYNNTVDTVQVRKVAVTLRDGSGTVAAAGDSVNVTPPFIAPGGHALVLFTVEGDRNPSHTYEATFDYQAGVTPDGFEASILVDNAAVRGDAIVGEMTNTTQETFSRLTATGMCFDPEGRITDRSDYDATTGPYVPGASATFSIPNYHSVDCTNFVVVGTGSP
jgi:hypothetical protein